MGYFGLGQSPALPDQSTVQALVNRYNAAAAACLALGILKAPIVNISIDSYGLIDYQYATGSRDQATGIVTYTAVAGGPVNSAYFSDFEQTVSDLEYTAANLVPATPEQIAEGYPVAAAIAMPDIGPVQVQVPITVIPAADVSTVATPASVASGVTQLPDDDYSGPDVVNSDAYSVSSAPVSNISLPGGAAAQNVSWLEIGVLALLAYLIFWGP